MGRKIIAMWLRGLADQVEIGEISTLRNLNDHFREFIAQHDTRVHLAEYHDMREPFLDD